MAKHSKKHPTLLTLASQEQHILRLVGEIKALVTKMKTAKAVDLQVLVEEYNAKVNEIKSIQEIETPLEGLCYDLTTTPAPEDWNSLDLFFGDIESAFANHPF